MNSKVNLQIINNKYYSINETINCIITAVMESKINEKKDKVKGMKIFIKKMLELISKKEKMGNERISLVIDSSIEFTTEQVIIYGIVIFYEISKKKLINNMLPITIKIIKKTSIYDTEKKAIKILSKITESKNNKNKKYL